MATETDTRAYLTAVGMTGDDTQIATLLTALSVDTVDATHDDVATLITAADGRFKRNVKQESFAALTEDQEKSLWRYRQLWAKVRGGADNDAALIAEGWKQSSAALAGV